MKKLTTAILSLLIGASIQAQNPIVQTCYSTDPAPMVHKDRVYVFTGQDEPAADFFWMYKWRLFSSADMVNWTDHGSAADLATFEWADDRAWAAQCIEANGKFYLYVCAHSKLTGAMAIGVAVSKNITGPYKDALGKPLADGNWDYIDPTVFIDDDGQAYLYWGNPRIYYVRLNKDMVSFQGEVQLIEQTEEGFGAPDPKLRNKDKQYKDSYVEGPWAYKRNGMYYMLYAAGGVPEHIAYSTAPSPTGPWTYRGNIMPLQDTKSFTNHCGVVTFKGHDYFFYHTGKLPGGGGFNRSVAVEEFKYNADGTFPIINATDQGVTPIGTLNPFLRTEAETIAFSRGLTTEWNKACGVYVADIHNNDYLKVREVDFSTTPQRITVSAASALQGGTIEVHADSLQGPLMAQVQVTGTGGCENWKKFSAPVTIQVQGKHNLYFVFKGHKGVKLFNLDWWRFDK